ncbi:MAG TPA: hypothetical protein H9834_09660 [Candidatus Barnesiella excrementavium]|nr:hypothetical protein [Candidatus Barnesiella excrementavium]
MEEYLRILYRRCCDVKDLVSQFEKSVDFRHRAICSASLLRLFDLMAEDIVFFYEQCTLYQRNLRRKNNPMSNLKTNKNGKK